MQLSGNASTLAPTHTAHAAVEEGATLGLLPGSPIDAQKALSKEISQLVRNSRPEIRQIEALFTLERQAQPVLNRLLAQYVEGDGQRRLFDWKAWQSALYLSQSLLQACQYFLLHIQRAADGKWTEHQRWVLAHLFRHRKIELLLRFVRYKKRNTDQWRELHDLYRFAHDRNLLGPAATREATETVRGAAGKIEQQYLQILLLEVMNSGHYSPREALWAYRWFARWCADPQLHLKISADVDRDQTGFLVNLDGPEGLKRVPVAGADLRHFDPAPLCALIEQEAAALRDAARATRHVSVAVRAGQLALLGRLAKLFSERPAPFERRAARTPEGVSVQAIAGLANIVDELRRHGRQQAGRPAAVAAPREGDTAAEFGAPDVAMDPEDVGWSGPDSLSSNHALDAAPQTWQVKDRSDTGCRMRGQIDNLNRVIPGSLIAIRETDASPWTISVVRWFRRLLADHVEIGVEYLGRRPRLVKLVAKYSVDLAADDASDTASRCFAALYLPASDERPSTPVKTLLLPTHEFRAGGEVTLLTSSATYRMRLNEPLQQQFEFVVTSFGVVDPPAPSSSGTP